MDRLSYEPYLERIQTDAASGDLGDLRLARKEFHRLTGEFEENEPWFDLRMIMFVDWYHLDRRGADELTPAERFVQNHGDDLDSAELLQFEQLTVTRRSVFRLSRVAGSRLLLDDLASGSQWSTYWAPPTVGLAVGDIIDARIAIVAGEIVTGRGAILHPREAHEALKRIIDRARSEQMPPRELVDHLDKMRLKLDRYSNVRVRHVYQYPTDALL